MTEGMAMTAALGVQREAVLFLSARNALEHQHQGAPRAADVDGLIGGIEHQHRHLQNVDVRVLHGRVVRRPALRPWRSDFCLRA